MKKLPEDTINPPDDWEERLILYMTSSGWIHDRNDKDTISFSRIENDKHWMRDYDKHTRSFRQFNGNQIVNIRVSKE